MENEVDGDYGHSWIPRSIKKKRKNRKSFWWLGIQRIIEAAQTRVLLRFTRIQRFWSSNWRDLQAFENLPVTTVVTKKKILIK